MNRSLLVADLVVQMWYLTTYLSICIPLLYVCIHTQMWYLTTYLSICIPRRYVCIHTQMWYLSTYLYVYHVCVCVYTHKCDINLSIHPSIHLSIYLSIHLSIYLSIYFSVNLVNLSKCIPRLYVCIHTHMCYAHPPMHTPAYTRTHTYIHIHTAHAHTHTHIRTYIYIMVCCERIRMMKQREDKWSM